MVECITQGWMWSAHGGYAEAHKLLQTGVTWEQCYDNMYADVIEVLKGEK
jgi:hypothetical protein